MKKNGCFITIILPCMLLLASTNLQGSQKGVHTTMNPMPNHTNSSANYSTYFGNLARTSFQQTTAAPEGQIAWTADISSLKVQNIHCMVTLGDVLILDAGTAAVALDLQGKEKWKVQKTPSCPVFVSGNQAWFLDDSYQMVAVDAAGIHTHKNIDFPEASSFNHVVSLLKTDSREYIAIVQFTGGAQSKPLVSVSRTPYDEFISTWVFHYPGRQASLPLWDESSGHLWLAISDMRIIEGKSGKVISQSPFPVDSLFSWCMGNDGCAILFGKKKEASVLLCVSEDSKERWRWVADAGLHLHHRQPPIVGADGRIFLLADQCVVCIDKSKTSSVFPIKNGDPLFGTALADGKLLVTAGNSLCMVLNDGSTRLLSEFDGPLVSVPITDSKGRIVIASERKLFCIR